jgi:hypothetical protein
MTMRKIVLQELSQVVRSFLAQVGPGQGNGRQTWGPPQRRDDARNASIGKPAGARMRR